MKRILALIIMTVIFATTMIPMTEVTANAVTITKSNDDGHIEGCTIRTYQKVIGYASGNSKESNIWIDKNQKFTVIREENGYFLTKHGKRYVWLKTNEVLINIKDYIPSLEIKLDLADNENLFSMGGKDIPGLTDKQFYYSSGATNGTEAWLMYNTAKLLLKAQQKFLADGYGIVVYDAYRPYSDTIRFRDAFSAFLNQQTKTFKSEWFGSLGEGWFLAQKASNHNYGVAVDISIKNLNTGKICDMPSRMHTLDKTSAYPYWCNEKSQETSNALYLKKTMESVGMSYLKSEWWHFEDTTTKKIATKMDIPN